MRGAPRDCRRSRWPSASGRRVTGLTEGMSAADGNRVGPAGLPPISDELGLDLVDAARRAERPMLAPMVVDTAGLRRHTVGALRPILSELVPVGDPQEEPGCPRIAAPPYPMPSAQRVQIARVRLAGEARFAESPLLSWASIPSWPSSCATSCRRSPASTCRPRSSSTIRPPPR